jgi:hypothetical protein
MAKHSENNTPDALFEIDAANWRLIEEAYGASLQPNIRADIIRATEVFLFSQNFERTDEAIAKVKVILEAHDSCHAILQRTLRRRFISFRRWGLCAPLDRQ